MGHRVRRSAGFLSFLFFVLSCPYSLFAQTPTAVSGTVTDVNGLAYANARVSATLIPTTASPTIIVNGIPTQIGGQFNAGTDVNGNFSLNLFCNTAGGGCSVISPSGTTWQITITTNGAPPPLGTGPQACTATLTISGASQSVTSSFSACPALSKTNGGGGVPITTVSGLASISGKTKGTLAVVTDGSSASDCTVGGGSNAVTCQYNGTVWAQLAASSSGSTAFTALTPGTNSNAGTFAASGNTWDFSAAGLFKLRIAAGCSTASNGETCFDTTASVWHVWQGGANRELIASTNLGNGGQPCLSNADGSCTFADPIVSGPDAVAAAPTKNPVQIGCLFLTTPATLTNNQVGALQCDSTQHLLVNVTNFPATQPISAVSLPLPTGAAQDSSLATIDTDLKASVAIAKWAGGTLGAMANYGTSPGAVLVPGVNAFITNTVPITVTSLPLPSGAATSANQCGASSPCEVSKDTSANSATDPLFVEPTDGTNAMGAMANFGTAPSAGKAFNANASVYIGTAPPDTNTGNASAQTQRFALATNNPAIANWGHGPTNAAPPANGVLGMGIAAVALPSAATATDTVAPMCDKFGRCVVLPQAPRDLMKPASVQTTNNTQTNLLAAQGSGVFADLIAVYIGTETGTACTVSLTDGTTTYKIDTAATIGAGVVFSLPVPIPATSSNTAWQVTGCTAVTLDYTALFVLNK